MNSLNRLELSDMLSLCWDDYYCSLNLNLSIFVDDYGMIEFIRKASVQSF